MKFFVIFISVVVVVSSNPIAQEDSVLRIVAGNFVNCMNSDLSLCLKEHALKATERLGTVRKLDIIDGITIYNNNPKEGRSYESLSTDPETRSKQITERLWESTTDLLQKSDLEFSYTGADDEEDQSRALGEAVEEGRGKKKKQLKKKLKLLIPLAILGKIKAVALVVIALLIIAASVFKLAVLAKIAFIAKVIAIIKALILAKKHSQEEHTWVTHEEHPHPAPSGWEGGWSRSRDEANNLAYSAYKQ
ncbi:uncharacterized protein LOC120634413 [Pararge aegeria]|uniref:Jg18229 protein n=1 Tax=Pararge aegeria aegeria TaxID=348720 RepID=A0A8S4RCP7_9NEOP|nr:uncharacterized protein LOC120634413 [Pararge aegeria]CAH2234563.1 jg18229 [Pararge aegeria aegeria]